MPPCRPIARSRRSLVHANGIASESVVIDATCVYKVEIRGRAECGGGFMGQCDGTFGWTRQIKKGEGLNGYVTWTNIESNKAFWAKIG